MMQLVKADHRLIPAGLLVVLMLLGISVACYWVVERHTTSIKTDIKSYITQVIFLQVFLFNI